MTDQMHFSHNYRICKIRQSNRRRCLLWRIGAHLCDAAEPQARAGLWAHKTLVPPEHCRRSVSLLFYAAAAKLLTVAAIASISRFGKIQALSQKQPPTMPNLAMWAAFYQLVLSRSSIRTTLTSKLLPLSISPLAER